MSQGRDFANQDEHARPAPAVLRLKQAVRAADAFRNRFWRTVLPQMSRWQIDRDEAEQLCFAFAAELDGIENLLAA